MSKKILAFVLAFALVFSTMTMAFADTTTTISADAQVAANLGVLKGATGTVDAAYTATNPTRIQAAIMFLRLKGLEADALAYAGTASFSDANQVNWAGGKAILAYLKNHPELGWVGNAGKFDPNTTVTTQQYYKVMLEALGYKQTSAAVVGDFEWTNVMAFAASKGLLKNAAVANFTVNDLAVATIEALKANMKEGGKTLAAALVNAGKINKEAAKAAGLYTETTPVTAAVDSVAAVGNTSVDVTFKTDINAAMANAANFSIAGLEVKSAAVADTDRIRLETAAMTAGKVYTVSVGTETAKFTGIAKATGTPATVKAESNDVEEVVVTFDKNMDLATAGNAANYSITGVQIAKAVVDGKTVTLTTVGLAARKQYTVKVVNVKSVDGVNLKSASESFYAKLDTAAPTVNSTVVAETNQRIIVTFGEPVTKESAENVANYTIKEVSTGAALNVTSAVLTTTGSNKNIEVTLTTDVQAANKKYELSIINIADRTKAANKITKAVTRNFYGVKEDTKAPVFSAVEAIARGLVKVTFTDDSMINADSVLDANNYTLKRGTTEIAVNSVEKISSENGKFVALLHVEDMTVGSYSVAAEGIVDEFGNDSAEVSKYFAVNTDTFASASITRPVISTTGKTITIVFDKSVNEAAAEDIANYSINKGIGAPVSAVYTDSNKTVILTVNDLLDNVRYDITINGVTDLAGNVLNTTFEDVYATGWDGDAPSMEDAYAINKNVVALTFDEAVQFASNTTLTLRPENVTGSAYDVVLKAQSTSNDDKVVEFADYTDSTTNVALADDVTYSVYSLVGTGGTGISDINGTNPFVLPTGADLANFKVYGTNENPERTEVVSIVQTNGKTFKLTMSNDIKGNATISDGTTTFNVTYKDNVATLITTGSAFTENQEFDLNLSAAITDMNGIEVIDDGETTPTTAKTTFYVENQDDKSPYIVNVVALDRSHVQVEYNEEVTNIDNGGNSYKVVNSDSDISTADMVTSAAVDTDNKKVVIITLATPLQSIYDYEMKINTANVKDIAGKLAEELVNDSFSFNGTDIAQH